MQVSAEFDPPPLWRNAAFTVIAYTAQTLMLIAYLIWFARLTQFFFFLSSSLRGAEFTIVPMYDDPMRRLGLGPLGGIYNTFLTLILMFEIYVAAHRVQHPPVVPPLRKQGREAMIQMGKNTRSTPKHSTAPSNPHNSDKKSASISREKSKNTVFSTTASMWSWR